MRAVPRPAACGCKGVVQAAVGWATGAKTRPSQARSPARRCPRGGCASTTATPFIPAKAGIQGHKRVHARLRRAMALGPRFRGDERKRACGKTHTLYFFQTAQPVSPARRVDDCRHKLQSWRLRYSNCVRDHNDRAGCRARAPDVACDRRDEQGLPTETIILEPSVSQLCDALRAWLAAMLPNWLVGVLGRTRPIDVDPLAPSEPALIDVRVRWAGL